MKTCYYSLFALILILNGSMKAQLVDQTVFGTPALDLPGMGSEKDLAEIKSRKLVVMIQKEDATTVAKLKKRKDPNELTRYQDQIAEMNKSILSVVDSLWPFHDTYTTKTFNQIKDMDKEDKQKYVVICLQRNVAYTSGGKQYYHELYTLNDDRMVVGEESVAKRSVGSSTDYTLLKVTQMEGLNKMATFQFPMPHVLPSTADIALGLSYAVWYMNQKSLGAEQKSFEDSISRNMLTLNNYTLLISEEDIEEGIITDLKEKYTYPYKIVSNEELDSIILNRVPGYAYFGYVYRKCCIMSTASMTPLFFVKIYSNADFISVQEMMKIIGKTKEKNE